ncbi:hypothetical protein [Streptobacillus moniliformis]|uniref:hypothetical protein n=1 Tax=Streptobacillus moniliformis TaxID=34105 RepID=UPI0007E3FE48|nr:hypothetical protein [Streptobacillus moniliformis]
MKKLVFLSLLGILLHANEAKTSGFLRSDLKYTHKLKEFEYDINGVRTKNIGKPLITSTNLDLDSGMYFYENKNLFLFGGVDTQNKKEEKKKDNKYANYYFGARLDSPISENFDLILTVGHKKGYIKTKNVTEDGKLKVKKEETKKVFENAVNEHAKVRNKKSNLKEAGYSLDVDRNTIISAVLNGRVNRKFNLILGSIYTSDNMKFGTHKYEGFVITSGRISRKSFLKTENSYIIDKNNIDEFGGIKSKYSISTKLSSKRNIENILVFEAKKLAKVNDFKFVSSNEYKDNIKNVNINTKINYETLIKAYKGGDYEHKPEVKINIQYYKNNIKLISSLENKLKIKHDFSKNALVKEFKNTLISEISLVNTKHSINNRFDFKYSLITDKQKNNKYKFTHEILIGPSLWYKKNNLNSTINLRYGIKHDGKVNNDIFTTVFNEKKYDINNNEINLNLNLYNYINFETLKFKKSNKLSNIFLVSSSFKYVNTYEQLKSTLFGELQYYNLFKEKSNSKDKDMANTILSKLNLELRYLMIKDVTTVFNLNNTYGYNLLDQENFKIFSDYIKNYGSGKYKDKKYTNLDNYIKKTSTINAVHSYRMNPKFSLVIRKLEGRLQLIPYIEGVLDFRKYRYNTASYAKELENKKKELEKAKQGSNERKNKLKIHQDAIKNAEFNKKFNFRNFEGRIGLNIKYTW